MTVTNGNLIFSSETGNLKDLTALDECTNFVNNAWQGSSLCNGGSSNQIRIGLVDFPIPANIKIIGITISGHAGGISATTQIGAGTKIDGTDYNNTNVGIDTGTFSKSFGMLFADYGQKLTFLAGVNYDLRGPSSIQIDNITFSTLVDDSINPNPPDNGEGDTGTPLPGCDNVTYISGSGPSCISLNDTVKMTSEISVSGNKIEFSLDTSAAIQFIGQTNWIPRQVSQSNYLIGEAPIGTTLFVFNIAATPEPSNNPNPIAIQKLTVFGPNTQTPFTLTFKVINVYDSATPPSAPTGQEFTSILDGLNGLKQEIHNQGLGISAELGDTKVGLKQSLDDIKNSLPADLVSSLISGLLGIPKGTVNAALSGLKIPQEFIDAIFEFIQSVIANIGDDAKILVPALIEQIKTNALNDASIITSEIQKSDDKQTELINKLLSGQYKNADTFYNDLNANFPTGELLVLLQNVITIFSGVFAFIHAKSDIVGITIKQLLLSQYTPLTNDLQTLVALKFKGQISLDNLYNDGAKLGLSKEKINNAIIAGAPLPPLDVITQDFMRGYINEVQHDGFMGRHGFSQDDINLIKASYQIIPNPTDITRLADKHIFSSDIPLSFGQYSEVPQAYLEAMAKWGLANDWTRKLWAAHWSLPGLQDAFSMFHRGIISADELNTYFSLTDILPFFREKLKALNYSLITRVDIRRFYSEGIFSEAQVLDAYKKLGFSDSDAKTQTQFTVTHERNSENPTKVKIRTLTEAMVVKAYKRGIITLTEAINRLGKVGYLPPDAEILIRLETQIDSASILADKTQHYHDKLFNHIVTSLSKGTISVQESRDYLGTIGTPQSEIESEISYATIERIISLKEYVEEHVRTAYTSGQVSKTDAINLMTSIGFNMSEIIFLFEELDLVKGLRNKALTETQLKDIYGSGQIDNNTLFVELTNIGYSEQHATWLAGVITGVV